jgi:hypothetical protein
VIRHTETPKDPDNAGRGVGTPRAKGWQEADMIALWLLACMPKAAPLPIPIPPSATLQAQPGDPEGLDKRMLTHYGYATAAQQAVIAGDLDGARVAGARLAMLPNLEGASPEWNSSLEWIRQRANEVAAADTLDKSASAVASLGIACGSCHSREKRGPVAPPPGTPDAEPMKAHQQATDAMWLGLITANATAFDAGLTVLSEAPTWDPRSEKPKFAVLQTRLYNTARRAGARSTGDRAALYGDVLATCAACHHHYR